MADGEEEKPLHINIKVVGQDQNEIAFKIKRTTPLKKLMDAYIAKTGVDSSAIRFLYEGQRLQPNQTPEELDMEDEDQIQTAVEQVGGFAL